MWARRNQEPHAQNEDISHVSDSWRGSLGNIQAEVHGVHTAG